jgi:glutathione S-transferase
VQREEQPLRVYGASISYYTGKLEGYLRFKEIPYERVTSSPRIMRRLLKETGADQIPAVELPDGRLLTDTTPIIDWLEAQYPEPPVIPRDPLQAFASRLLEDYAEEWLWRPAMHYRWSYRTDALHLSRKIVDELLGGVPLPAFLKRIAIRRRQYGGYVRGDGVSRETWDHVEGIYRKTLAQLEAIFERRPYLLGDLPTLADFGFFASMFRHFAQDPTASDLMRQHAPGVFEWQARLWNARASRLRGALIPGIPADWSPILSEIGSAYLPFLNANATAWKAGQRRFATEIQGVRYRNLPVSHYRVWCLERLRAHFDALAGAPRNEARSLLVEHDCWEPLEVLKGLDSDYDPDGRVPFRGGRVHYPRSGGSPS